MEKAIDLTAHAIRHGWATITQQGTDSGGAHYINVEGGRAGSQDGYFRVTWHTRGAKTYRLFSCWAGPNKGDWTSCSLKTLNAYIEGRDRL